MFPSLLVLLHGVECFDLRLLAVESALFHGGDDPQHMVVIVGEDFLKFGQELAEIVQDLLAAGRAGQLDVLPDELFRVATSYLCSTGSRLTVSLFTRW